MERHGMTALVEIRGLTARLPVEGGLRTVLHDVSLTVAAGEALGLVGESGAGKSMTALAIARLLPRGAQTNGSVLFDGRDVLGLGGSDLRRYREEVAIVFQDPRAHVNPVRRIGDFMTETLRLKGVARAEAAARAAQALRDVGGDDGERRLEQYPHELSGGLLQRVMIATMLLGRPRLVLADEPTTALDVTTQAEVMAILDELRRERGLALLFITHDLDLAAAVCDRTAVMYAGQIFETNAADLLDRDPLHPYTAALAGARPDIAASTHRLAAIPGRPVSAFEAPSGCAFAPRCALAQDACRAARPPLESLDGGEVRCRRARELRGRLPGAIRGASEVSRA
jgi:oligopeptide/dipeptide ABC transporter ATP-binding protein